MLLIPIIEQNVEILTCINRGMCPALEERETFLFISEDGSTSMIVTMDDVLKMDDKGFHPKTLYYAEVVSRAEDEAAPRRMSRL